MQGQQTTMIGTVTNVIYSSKDRQIVNIKTRLQTIRVLINNSLDHVEAKDHVHIVGVTHKHINYGEQVIAEQIKHCAVSTELLKDFLKSGSGIGEKIAGRLIEKFGNDLIYLIEKKDIDKLSSVNKVSKSLATTICNSWHKQAGKLKLIEFINNIMANASSSVRNRIMKIAKKAYTFYGENTVSNLKEDPYRIWAFSGFNDADLFAQTMNIEKSDIRRLLCAVEEILYKGLHNGSTRLSPTNLAQGLDDIIGKDLTVIAIYQALNQSNRFPARFIVSQPQNTFDLPENEQVYHRKVALPAAAEMENYIVEQILSRIHKGISSISIPVGYLNSYLLPNNYKLSHNQKAAVNMVMQQPVCCISGGAGTGKTSVLYCIHDIINADGGSVLQIALSGKATRRLAQQTNQDAMTIEALLTKVKQDSKFLDSYTLPLILIDEASMVDLQSMYRVLIALKEKPARIVFIGDWAQLPPVGRGLIYHPLMTSKKVQSIELTDNFRSVKKVSDATENIKNGLPVEQSKEVKVLEANTVEEMLNIAKRQFELHLNSSSLHIIAARTKTVAALNFSLHELLLRGRKPIPCAPQFKVDDSVIYKKNNDELGIVNGSTGKVINGDNNSITVNFDCEGVVSIPTELLSDKLIGEYYLQHAYAITCHSAQGSEFETVIVVVEDKPMVERSWLYTAVSRAQKRVILVTFNNSIKKALKRSFKFEQIDVGFEL